MQSIGYSGLDCVSKGISRRNMLKGLAGGAAVIAAAKTIGGLPVARVAGQDIASIEPALAEIGDTALAYIEMGQGAPVVLVHGTLNDFRGLGMQAGAIASGYRAISVSRRYHWPFVGMDAGEDYAADRHAGDLAAFIEAVSDEPVHLVGASYGGLTSLLTAVQRPELVRSLVLSEPPLFLWLAGSTEGQEMLGGFSANVWEPARAAFEDGLTEDAIRIFLNGAAGHPVFDYLPDFVKMMMLDNAPALGLEVATGPEAYFSMLQPEQVEAVQVPTLLIQGESSPPMFHLVQDELERRLPMVERVTIEKASHAAHADNPAAFNETVLAFLAQV